MLVTIPVPGLRKRPPVIVLISMPVWEGLKGLMYVTAAGSKGITVIVCVAGNFYPESDMGIAPKYFGQLAFEHNETASIIENCAADGPMMRPGLARDETADQQKRGVCKFHSDRRPSFRLFLN